MQGGSFALLMCLAALGYAGGPGHWTLGIEVEVESQLWGNFWEENEA